MHKNKSQHTVPGVLTSADQQLCPLWFSAGIRNVGAHYFCIISSIMSPILTPSPLPQLTWILKHAVVNEQTYESRNIFCYLVLVETSSDNLTLETG